MRVVASAPGKLFLLGEYAVLEGSPALVGAVSARASVHIRSQAATRWSLISRQASDVQQDFVPGEPTGVALFDVVVAQLTADGASIPPCEIALNTVDFFSPALGQKLGLGSSAALLVALTNALGRWIGVGEANQLGEHLSTLRELHGQFQGDPGSGADLAASLKGGLIRYQRDKGGAVEIGSVALPDSVGFACICTAQAASSARLVGLFRRWKAAHPVAAAAQLAAFDGVAGAACQALVRGDADGFLAAVTAYGELLAALGRALGTAIITVQHEQIGTLAEQYGVTYKISGAGGGDLGVALAQDPDQLQAFVARARSLGFESPDLHIDDRGLIVEGPLDD